MGDCQQAAPRGELLAGHAPLDDAEPLVPRDATDDPEGDHALPHLVVGIGAAAGGTAACIELVQSLPPDTGMAFIVVPPQMADRHSHLVEILTRYASMPVVEVIHALAPEPNHVYVLPSGARISLKRGVFCLEGHSASGEPRSIDHFFGSLAASQKGRAIGVVLSGTDGDGALGLKAIKGEGGIAILQGPDSARSSELPRNGIPLDCIDRMILTAREIAVELAEVARQSRQPALRGLEEGTPQPGEEIASTRILNLLRGVSGVDFRLYKPAIVRRRIARRMLLQRIRSLAEYAACLQRDAMELRDLHEDVLISATRFFRDPGVFAALQGTILPRIFANRDPDQPLRIWVAGCSSGEEVYSIAIGLMEYLAEQPRPAPVQIFGTDVSDHNIQKARNGIFSESVADEVSPERLQHFFVKVAGGYQISRQVRDLCVFALQNLCQDPPLPRMDLISCRNVLINLGSEQQKKILAAFHYALRPNGFLLLGISETTRESTDLFQPIDRKHKFLVKIGDGPSRATMSTTPRLFLPDAAAPPAPAGVSESWGDIGLRRAADRIVLARHGPPGIVVDENLEILQSRGHTAPFLEMPHGMVTLQMTRMLRDSIASPVSQAVRRAIEQDLPVRLEGLRVLENDTTLEVAVEVLPIRSMTPQSRRFLVLFAPSRQTEPAGGPEERGDAPSELPDMDQLPERLREDLSSTRVYLQTLLDEREARNQELVLANDEIQSLNEAMHSANEELENTKQELQRANELLRTVGDLKQRNTALARSVDDLSNLLNSANLPMLVLSSELHIRQFTPSTQRLMNLRSHDIGRPFTDIRLNLRAGDFEAMFREVLETLTPREMEVQDREGLWYLLRVRPYRTAGNSIEGVAVVLLNIDQLQRSQQELRGARDFARSVIGSVPLPLAVIDLDFRIRTVNDAFRTLAGIGTEDVDRRSLPDLASALWDLRQPLRSHLENLRAAGDGGSEFAFEARTSGENSRVFDVRGWSLKSGGEAFLVVTMQDITAHREAERLLALEKESLAGEVASKTLELGRTQDELRALAASLFTSQEVERRRVARELHDDISQKLAMLEINAQQIEPQIGSDPDQARKELEGVRTGIGALSADVRRISHALHPSVIEDLGIRPAIRSLVEDFRDREHMIVTFRSYEMPDVSIEIATGLYRITQEALRNVARHAGKTHVKVLLKGETRRIRLQVIDSGEGFDPQARRSGLGLISMEERARIMRGTLSIESKPGEGTRVMVDIPLP